MRTWIVLLCGACVAATLPGDVCAEAGSAAGCNADADETSMLAKIISRHQGSQSVRRANGTTEAKRFFYELTKVNNKTAKQWNATLNKLFDCQQAVADYKQGKSKTTCDSEGRLKKDLESIATDAGFKTTLDDIITYASGFYTSNIVTFSALYSARNILTSKAMQVQLYATDYDMNELIVGGVNITGFKWTPNCGNISCISEPNVLSWKKGKGNPNSGRLNFVYITPFVENMPANAYFGPYFYGVISDTQEEVSKKTKPNIYGVLFQNGVINQSPLEAARTALMQISSDLSDDPTQSMKAGVPMEELVGLYCLFIAGKSDPKYSNLTIGEDGLLMLGSETIPNYRLDNNRLTWDRTATVEYSGNLYFASNDTHSEFIGGLTTKDGQYYSAYGSTTSTPPQCYEAPPPPENRSSWKASWAQKHEKLLITGGVVVGIAGISGGGYLLATRYNRAMGDRVEFMERAWSGSESSYGDPMDFVEPSPFAVESDLEMYQHWNNQIDSYTSSLEADAAMQAAVARIEELEAAMEYVDNEELLAELRAQESSVELEFQQAETAEAYYSYQEDIFNQAAIDAAAESTELADADLVEQESYESELEEKWFDEGYDDISDVDSDGMYDMGMESVI